MTPTKNLEKVFAKSSFGTINAIRIQVKTKLVILGLQANI
jgi:hypothetical protein